MEISDEVIEHIVDVMVENTWLEKLPGIARVHFLSPNPDIDPGYHVDVQHDAPVVSLRDTSRIIVLACISSGAFPEEWLRGRLQPTP